MIWLFLKLKVFYNFVLIKIPNFWHLNLFVTFLGFVVCLPDGSAFNVKADVISYNMDWKAANLYLGIGGAYCDVCHLSKRD